MADSQADFASASEAITSANDALVAGLQGLGTPPAPATTAAKNAVDDLSANLQKEAGNIEKAVAHVSTQSELVTASSKVRASISRMNGDISDTVTKLEALPDTEGWKQAFRVAECKSVAKG
jgi:phage shock protein A